jgi:peptidoglycan hydrolase-like protein with peptidoglycan-binding domain
LFLAYPTYSRYRTLALLDPYLKGEDVFALQTALAACGFSPGVPDGILGPATSRAIRAAQLALNQTVDGLAGGNTQEALAREALQVPAAKYSVLKAAMRGQIEFESGFRLGNYSPQRPDGSYDAGVTQRNTQHTPAAQGFNVPDSLDALAANTRKYYDLFEGVPSRRRWALAQGAWNAPAFACWVARGEGATKVTTGMTLRPTESQRVTFEAYVANVSIYLN